MDAINLQGLWTSFPGTSVLPRYRYADFGLMWLEIEDPATVSLINPRTHVTTTVENVLLRQTHQKDVITANQTIDGFWLTAHLWKDKLQGVVPKEGMFMNDGSYEYELKQVKHSSRRRRFECLCLRRRRIG